MPNGELAVARTMCFCLSGSSDEDCLWYWTHLKYVFYNIIVRKTKGELFDYLRGYICYSDKKSKEGEKEVKMFLKSRKERGWNGLES